MSALNDERAEKKGRNRGKTNNSGKLARLGKEKRPEGSADWGDVDPAWIAALVVLLTQSGGALRFGRSRDGAVLSLGVYYQDDSTTLWLDGDGTIEEQMSSLYEEVRVIVGE